MTWHTERAASYNEAWRAIARLQARGYVCTCTHIDGWEWVFSYTTRANYQGERKERE